MKNESKRERCIKDDLYKEQRKKGGETGKGLLSEIQKKKERGKAEVKQVLKSWKMGIPLVILNICI